MSPFIPPISHFLNWLASISSHQVIGADWTAHISVDAHPENAFNYQWLLQEPLRQGCLYREAKLL